MTVYWRRWMFRGRARAAECSPIFVFYSIVYFISQTTSGLTRILLAVLLGLWSSGIYYNYTAYSPSFYARHRPRKSTCSVDQLILADCENLKMCYGHIFDVTIESDSMTTLTMFKTAS